MLVAVVHTASGARCAVRGVRCAVPRCTVGARVQRAGGGCYCTVVRVIRWWSTVVGCAQPVIPPLQCAVGCLRCLAAASGSGPRPGPGVARVHPGHAGRGTRDIGTRDQQGRPSMHACMHTRSLTRTRRAVPAKLPALRPASCPASCLDWSVPPSHRPSSLRVAASCASKPASSRGRRGPWRRGRGPTERAGRGRGRASGIVRRRMHACACMHACIPRRSSIQLRSALRRESVTAPRDAPD